MLSVIGYLFFLCTIVDSLYEGVTPRARFYGVSRLNTRFSFYVYTRAKLASPQGMVMLQARSVAFPDESILAEYVIE